MIRKDIKRILTVEYELDIEDFKKDKLANVSNVARNMYKSHLVELTTFIVKDKVLITYIDKQDVFILGIEDNIIDVVPLSSSALLNLDNKMISTLKIAIVKDSKLDTDIKAIDYAQNEADKMFEKDDSKIPLITIKDYRNVYSDKLISATVFGGLIGDVVGDAVAGAELKKEIEPSFYYKNKNRLRVGNDVVDYFTKNFKTEIRELLNYPYSLVVDNIIIDFKSAKSWLVNNNSNNVTKLIELNNNFSIENQEYGKYIYLKKDVVAQVIKDNKVIIQIS